ncbi:MAG: cytochrome c [Acidobacteriia bacterium]|nr:cytochrome c [Terriglobia bacterium]
MKPTPCAFPKLQVSLLMLLLAAGSINLAAQATAKPSRGATLFAANCSSCHGSDATGDTSLGKALGAANLHAPDVQNLSDAALKKVIAGGSGNMPSFGRQLSDAELALLVSHLREIGGSKSVTLGSPHPRCTRHRAAHRCCNSTLD